MSTGHPRPLESAREQAPWTLALRAIRVIVRSAGVPPVSVHVIVRSAHSALARKLSKPRSIFIVYAPYVRLRGVPPVSVRVIVRSAHSAPVRKLFNPRSELNP